MPLILLGKKTYFYHPKKSYKILYKSSKSKVISNNYNIPAFFMCQNMYQNINCINTVVPNGFPLAGLLQTSHEQKVQAKRIAREIGLLRVGFHKAELRAPHILTAN